MTDISTTPDDDLIERVARAIYGAHPWGDEDSDEGIYAWEDMEDEWRDVYRLQAAAAIKAIREPTRAMRLAWDEHWPRVSAADEAWSLGIDAALNPANPEGEA